MSIKARIMHHSLEHVQVQLTTTTSIFSLFCGGGSEGLSCSTDLVCEDEYCGAEDQAEPLEHSG